MNTHFRIVVAPQEKEEDVVTQWYTHTYTHKIIIWV